MVKLYFKCIIAVSLFVQYSQAQVRTKRALVIAIGHYPAESNWPLIHSFNDLPLILGALKKQEFLTENIAVLKDQEATKSAILQALDQLTEKARPGDVVFIHISSHGEQIEDDNGDESDKLDECIVPYGAVYSEDEEQFKKLADGYLRDDLFGQKITLLRNKLGKEGDVLINLDACHSGTGTRGGGAAPVRGNKKPMISRNFNNNNFLLRDTAGVFKDNNSTKLDPNAASYIVISGAQATEKNQECYDDQDSLVGSLSYSMSKCLNALSGKITYRSLFAQIEDVMRNKVYDQRPVIEGDGLDRELFGGEYKQQSLFYSVDLKQSVGKKIRLNAGAVAGITVGSVVSFFPIGTNDPRGKEPLQKGIVTEAMNFSSTVELEKESEILLNTASWAFLTEIKFGANKLSVNIDSLSGAEAIGLKESLKKFPLVEFGTKSDLYFGRSEIAGKWSLRFPVTGLVFSDKLDLSDVNGIKEAFKRFDRFRYLRNLKFAEEGLSAKVSIVFLDEKGKIDAQQYNRRLKNGRLELKEDDVVHLQIINTGNQKIYFNMVDIQSDGKITPIYPNANLKNKEEDDAPIKWSQCTLEWKDTLLQQDYSFHIGPPYGEETFKVFISDKPLDLEEILISNNDTNSKDGGVLNSLAKLFRESSVNENGTRDGDGKIRASKDGTVFSVNFRIVPK